MAPVSLGDYLKRICTSFGALAALGAILPLASLAGDWAAFLFPPLGDLTPIARIGCVVAVLVVICCGYVGVGGKGLKKWILMWCVLALASAFGYVYYSLQYVLRIPSGSAFFLVSIGSEKTDFAVRTFAKGESQWEMVESRGLSDEQITKLWTSQSVLRNRLELFFTYTTCAICWAAIFALTTALEINSGAKAAEA